MGSAWFCRLCPRVLSSPAPAAPGALAARESPASGHAHPVQLPELGRRRASVTTALALPPAPGTPHVPSSRPLTGHAEDAGTGWGLWSPFCAGAPVWAQHQALGAATGEAACRIEAPVRAEIDASPTFIHVHVTVLPSPARGALALVGADADASVLAGLGADGCRHGKWGSRPGNGPAPQPRGGAPLPETWKDPASPSSQVLQTRLPEHRVK